MSAETVTTPVTTTEPTTTQPVITTAPVTTTQPATTPTVPTHTPLEVEKVVAMSPAEYRAMQDQIATLNRMQADLAAAKAQAEQAELERLKQKGEVAEYTKRLDQISAETKASIQQEAARQVEAERVLARQLKETSDREKATLELSRRETEARAQRYALDGELSRALSNANLMPGAAEHLTELWRKHFAVSPDGESFVVKTSTGQSVSEFVAQQLALPTCSYFVKAGNPTGGTATVQTNQSGPTPAAFTTDTTVKPRNLGEVLLLDFPNGPPHLVSSVSNANSNRDMTQSMGLRKKA